MLPWAMTFTILAGVVGLLYGIWIERIERLADTRNVELRKSGLWLRALLQASNDAIVSTDSHETIASWNRAAQQIFGHDESEAIGRPVSMLFKKVQSDGVTQAPQLSTIAKRQFVGDAVEVDGLRRDKTVVPLAVTLSHWATEGKASYTAILRDLSDRKDLEDEMRNSCRATRLWLI